jgi:hypothetical protein
MPFLYIILGLAFVAEGARMLVKKKQHGTEDDPLVKLNWVDKQMDQLASGDLSKMPTLETRLREIVKEELRKKEPPKA